MTIAEMVETYGEVRITKISAPALDEKTGLAIVQRSIVNNQLIEANVPEVHYRVAPRDGEPTMGITVDEALGKVI